MVSLKKTLKDEKIVLVENDTAFWKKTKLRKSFGLILTVW